MKKDQRIENALHASSLKPLSDEQISGAKNRVWAAIQEEKVTKAAISFWSFSFNRQLVPVLATYSLIIAILIGSTFALLPAPQQTQTLAIIKKTLRVDVPIDTPQDQPSDVTTPQDNQPDKVLATSTYKNDELGFSVDFPGQWTKTTSKQTKKGFELKDSLALKNENATFASVGIYTAPNDKKQPVDQWLKDHSVNGTQTKISYGSFNGVLVKNKTTAYNPLLNLFVAHAADNSAGDAAFYVANNGQILQIATEFAPDADVVIPEPEVVYQTFTRAPRPAFQYNFASLKYDNKIFVFGGVVKDVLYKDAGRKVNMYDPEIDAWTEKNAVPEQLFKDYFSLINGVVIDNKAYFVASFNNNHDSRPDVLIYDFVTDSWTYRLAVTAPYPTTFTGGAVVVLNSKIYIVGGQIYDPSKTTRKNNYDRSLVETVNTMYIYDPQLDTWQTGPNLNISRNTRAVAVFNGRIYATLGESGDMTLNEGKLSDLLKYSTLTSEYYDPDDNQWHLLHDFPTNVIVSGGRLYLLDHTKDTLYFFDQGELDLTSPTDSISSSGGIRSFMYDSQKDTWTRIYPTFQVREVRGTVGFDNSIFLFGTHVKDSNDSATRLEEFVPKPK